MAKILNRIVGALILLMVTLSGSTIASTQGYPAGFAVAAIWIYLMGLAVWWNLEIWRER